MKKSISLFLILSVIFSFCVFSFPVNAIASEVIIIGGTIAALAAATGAYITVTDMSDNDLSQYLYNRVIDFGNRIAQENIIAYILAGTAIEKGKIKLTNAVSTLLSRFIADDLNNANTTFGTIEINSEQIQLPTLQFFRTNTAHPRGFLSNANKLTWYDRGTILNIGNKTLTIKSDGKLYINNVAQTKITSTSGIPNYITNYQIQYVMGDYRDKFALCLNKNESNSDYELTILQCSSIYENPVEYNDIAGTTVVTKYKFADKLNYPVNNHNFQTDAYVDLPADTLNPEDNTYITIGAIEYNYTLEQAASSALTQTIDGTIESTFENAQRIEPIAPETNQDWITSFHGIWYYVEYLIDKASQGYIFFTNLISSIPDDISFCYLGAFVLLLFGGVISRLLL